MDQELYQGHKVVKLQFKRKLVYFQIPCSQPCLPVLWEELEAGLVLSNCLAAFLTLCHLSCLSRSKGQTHLNFKIPLEWLRVNVTWAPRALCCVSQRAGIQKVLVTFLKRSLFMDTWFLFVKRHLGVDFLQKIYIAGHFIKCKEWSC